jgi:hypothetical protein
MVGSTIGSDTISQYDGRLKSLPFFFKDKRAISCPVVPKHAQTGKAGFWLVVLCSQFFDMLFK